MIDQARKCLLQFITIPWGLDHAKCTPVPPILPSLLDVRFRWTFKLSQGQSAPAYVGGGFRRNVSAFHSGRPYARRCEHCPDRSFELDLVADKMFRPNAFWLLYCTHSSPQQTRCRCDQCANKPNKLIEYVVIHHPDDRSQADSSHDKFSLTHV